MSRTVDGVYLGVVWSTGESLVGTKDGVYKAKSLHRKPADERRNVQEILGVRGTPWKPYQFSEDDRLRVSVPTTDDIDAEPRARTGTNTDEYIPRAFKIEKKRCY